MIKGLNSTQIYHGTRQKKSTCYRGMQAQTNTSVASKNIKYTGLNREPAQISFSGFYCPKQLENLKVIETLENLAEVEDFPLRKIFNAARKFVTPAAGEKAMDEKTLHHTTKDLITEVIDAVQNSENPSSEKAQKFLQEEGNHKSVKTFLEDLKDVMKHSEPDQVIDNEHPEYKKVVKKSVGEAVDVLNSIDKPSFIYTKKWVKSIFESAERNQAMFSAAYSLMLAGLLRPATIVSLPGKKNKEDKIYAAAHSISSGSMGYLAALAISKPIASAVKKIANQPDKFLNDETIEFFKDKKQAKPLVPRARKIAEDAFQLGETKKFGIARKYMNMIPEAVTAVPQAIITIALIPVVLKYVFGLEKKAHGAAKPSQQIPAQAQPPQSNFMAFKPAGEQVRKVFKNFMGESK